ncbi:unnamed protein product, partial [Onchocerca ochengi]
SALAVMKKTAANGPKPTANPKKPNKGKRPCGFCNKDHWDNECRNYPTFKQRMEYLAKIKACLNCLKPGHTTENCNLRKRSCFHCKGPHNTALCCIKYGLQTNESKGQQSNAIVANSITQEINLDEKEVLLLCNEVTVSKPNMPETRKGYGILRHWCANVFHIKGLSRSIEARTNKGRNDNDRHIRK